MFLSLEEKGHAFFYGENISAATVTMKVQLLMIHTIASTINTVIQNLLSNVKEMWILLGITGKNLTSFLKNSPSNKEVFWFAVCFFFFNLKGGKLPKEHTKSY